LRAFQDAVNHLRTLRRLGASHESVTMCLARLRKLDSAAGMPPLRHRTFEELARSWARPASIEVH
jgi:hypothetical protein